jgi:hypothetical protein
VQLDEKWPFVGCKQKRCDPDDERDWSRGDQWGHVAYGPDSRLVLEVVVGQRLGTTAEMLLEGLKGRLGGAAPGLVSSDGYASYEGALLGIFGEEVTPPRTGKPGRPAGPRVEPPAGTCYGRVIKHKRRGRLERVEAEVVFGEVAEGQAIGTAYLGRQNATDRHRNGRKGRKTYRFSKGWETHEAMTAFTMYSYNFCWAVRTLRVKDGQGQWWQRTPAMAAGLANQVWSLEEWLTLPAVQH